MKEEGESGKGEEEKVLTELISVGCGRPPEGELLEVAPVMETSRARGDQKHGSREEAVAADGRSGSPAARKGRPHLDGDPSRWCWPTAAQERAELGGERIY